VDRKVTARVRYALLGVGGLALAIVVGFVLAAVLQEVTTPTASPGATTPSTAPAVTPAAPPPAEGPAPVQRPEPGVNECVDDLGDGQADLDSVQLALHDDDLVAQFRFASALPDDGGLGLTIQRGDKSYLLGVAFENGDVDSVFVQDFDRSDTDGIDTDNAVVDGSTVTVVFPRDAIKRIGNDWSWSAFATPTGSSPDTCPADGQQLRFER
jgi:hypothetical protein